MPISARIGAEALMPALRFNVLLRPLSGSVQYAQHSHQVTGNVVNQDVVSMCDKLARALQSARPAKARMIQQASGLLG